MLAYKCIESWKKYFPHWEIILWNEQNSPMQHPYMQQAYANKKWSNLSNYTRLFALKNHGGIYFDTDVEVIRAFDFLEKYTCFVGFESPVGQAELSINNAILGASKGHLFIDQCLTEIETKYDGTEIANFSSPVLTTEVLRRKGLVMYGEQDVQDVHVFDMKAFYPYTWDDLFTYACVTEKTYTIHYWDMSWKDKEVESKELLAQLKVLKENINELDSQVLEIRTGKMKITKWLKISFRFFRHLLLQQ